MKFFPLAIFISFSLMSITNCKLKTKEKGNVCIEAGLHDYEGSELRIDPVHPAPPFYLDSVITGDSSLFYASYHIKLDSSLKKHPLNVANKTNPHSAARVNETWPISFAVTGNLVCQVFVHQTHEDDAAHFYFDISTSNYDLVTKKEVALTDVFFLRNNKEKQEFLDCLNKTDVYSENDILGDSSLLDMHDFYIGCGMLTIYPKYYPIYDQDSEGFGFPLEKAAKFIRPEYKYLLE
jgi:hypothetical protein